MTGTVDDAYAQLRAFARAARGRGGGVVPPGANRRAAVLMLFGVLDDAPARAHRGVAAELDLLLVRRADTLTHHPGQIAFPGGGVDPGDADEVAAALREAQEETGLDAAGVRVLGSLPVVDVTPSNYAVTPVLGWWARPSPVRPLDPRESSDVFRAPVADLLDPSLRRSAVLRIGSSVIRTPAFVLGPHVVWGFTAMILDRLFDDLGWSVPWDAGRTVDVRRR